jgi:hypothetical protein
VKKLTSATALAVVIGLVVAITPAVSGATIVRAVTGGPFSRADALGTIMAINLVQGNTYDFTFDLAPGSGTVLTQVQASIVGPVSEPIQFSLYSGSPGSGSLLDTSAFVVGPSLTDTLNAGLYYIQIDDIARNDELLAGGLDVAAIPEPASWGVMLVGLGVLGGTLRRVARRVTQSGGAMADIGTGA